IKTILIADTIYLKYLIKNTKVEPHFGHVTPCAIEDYEHIDIVLIPNYQATHYNPDIQTKIDMCNLTLKNHMNNSYVVPGTGKSFLSKYLINAVEAQAKMYALLLKKQPDKSEFETMLTATTNQAAAVLKEITNMDATTIHSMLRLTVSFHPKTGKPMLRKRKDYKQFFNKLVIIDEASRVDDVLADHIDKTICDSKIVFIGDKYQLAPVGKNVSIMDTLNCTQATMNQVMRNQG
ncbi:unnamed protein product, partial [marine sediment metagenome]